MPDDKPTGHKKPINIEKKSGGGFAQDHRTVVRKDSITPVTKPTKPQGEGGGSKKK
jgi:hypothetical protein